VDSLPFAYWKEPLPVFLPPWLWFIQILSLLWKFWFCCNISKQEEILVISSCFCNTNWKLLLHWLYTTFASNYSTTSAGRQSHSYSTIHKFIIKYNFASKQTQDLGLGTGGEGEPNYKQCLRGFTIKISDQQKLLPIAYSQELSSEASKKLSVVGCKWGLVAIFTFSKNKHFT